MALGVGAESPEQQRRHRQQRQPACDAVRELDQGFDPFRARDDLSLTERPVIAAAGARAGCPYECAPDNHDDIRHNHAPGKLCKTLTCNHVSDHLFWNPADFYCFRAFYHKARPTL
jgi:hypothetical protein